MDRFCFSFVESIFCVVVVWGVSDEAGFREDIF
jgi:hypothetical protein